MIFTRQSVLPIGSLHTPSSDTIISDTIIAPVITFHPAVPALCAEYLYKRETVHWVRPILRGLRNDKRAKKKPKMVADCSPSKTLYTLDKLLIHRVSRGLKYQNQIPSSEQLHYMASSNLANQLARLSMQLWINTPNSYLAFNPLMPTVAIKHHVPDRVKPSFVIFDTRAL